MLEPKRDNLNKDEDKITDGKLLIKKLYKQYHHALHCKSTWIKEALSIRINAVVKFKDKKLHIVTDA